MQNNHSDDKHKLMRAALQARVTRIAESTMNALNINTSEGRTHKRTIARRLLAPRTLQSAIHIESAPCFLCLRALVACTALLSSKNYK